MPISAMLLQPPGGAGRPHAEGRAARAPPHRAKLPAEGSGASGRTARRRGQKAAGGRGGAGLCAGRPRVAAFRVRPRRLVFVCLFFFLLPLLSASLSPPSPPFSLIFPPFPLFSLTSPYYPYFLLFPPISLCFVPLFPFYPFIFPSFPHFLLSHLPYFSHFPLLRLFSPLFHLFSPLFPSFPSFSLLAPFIFPFCFIFLNIFPPFILFLIFFFLSRFLFFFFLKLLLVVGFFSPPSLIYFSAPTAAPCRAINPCSTCTMGLARRTSFTHYQPSF